MSHLVLTAMFFHAKFWFCHFLFTVTSYVGLRFRIWFSCCSCLDCTIENGFLAFSWRFQCQGHTLLSTSCKLIMLAFLINNNFIFFYVFRCLSHFCFSKIWCCQTPHFYIQVLPTIVKLFASNDRAIRVGLLQHIDQYGESLSAQIVDEQVW